MGNIMRSLSKRMTKPIRDYNLEARINKVLQKEKPVAAPHYKLPESSFTKLSTDTKNTMQEDIYEKKKDLLERLDQVYVTSSGSNPVIERVSMQKALPIDRQYIEEPLYGYHEPKKVSYGKITLKNMLELIARNQQDSEKWSARLLAEEYKLDACQTEQVLKYFRTFTLVIPTTKEDAGKDKLATPELSLGTHAVVYLPQKEEKKDDKYEQPPTDLEKSPLT